VIEGEYKEFLEMTVRQMDQSDKQLIEMVRQMRQDRWKMEQDDRAIKMLSLRYRELKKKRMEPADWLKILEKLGFCQLSMEAGKPHRWVADKGFLYTLHTEYLKIFTGMTLKALCSLFVGPDGKKIKGDTIRKHYWQDPEFGDHYRKFNQEQHRLLRAVFLPE